MAPIVRDQRRVQAGHGLSPTTACGATTRWWSRSRTPANRCSSSTAAGTGLPRKAHPLFFARAIALCRRAGFGQTILLRGDTAFSQTSHLDRWDDDGVRFVFGFDASKPMVERAEGDDASEYEALVREADMVFEGRERRAKRPRTKEQVVREREYRNLRLEREDVAEFEHRPTRATRSYRFVVLRKTLVEERGQRCLGHPSATSST